MAETNIPDKFDLFLDPTIKLLETDLVVKKLTPSQLSSIYVTATGYGDPFQLVALQYQNELAQALSSTDTTTLRTTLLTVFRKCQANNQTLTPQLKETQSRKLVTPHEIAALAEALVGSAKKTQSSAAYQEARLTKRKKISDKIQNWINTLKQIQTTDDIAEEIKSIATAAQERLIDVIEQAAAAATPELFQKTLTENLPEIIRPLSATAKTLISTTLTSATSEGQFIKELIKKNPIEERISAVYGEIIKNPDSLIRPDILVSVVIDQPGLPLSAAINFTRVAQALSADATTSSATALPQNIFSIFALSPNAGSAAKSFAPILDAFFSLPGVPASAKDNLVKKIFADAIQKEGAALALTLPPEGRQLFTGALTHIVHSLGLVPAAITPKGGLATIKSAAINKISSIFAPILVAPARAFTQLLSTSLKTEGITTAASGVTQLYPRMVQAVITRWQILVLAAAHVISPSSTSFSGGFVGNIFHWVINWATHEGIKRAAAKTASKSLISWLLAAAAAPITGGTSLLAKFLAGSVIDRVINNVFNFGKNALFLFSNWFDKVQNGEAPAEATLVLVFGISIVFIGISVIFSPLGTWHTEVATFQDELQPFIIDEPGSTYIKVTKTPSPANLPNNPTTPIAYTVTIEANGATLENIQITDVPSLYTKSGSINLPKPTLPTIPTSLTPGSPVSFNYTLTPPPNTQDSVLTNSLTISATVNGKPETKTVSSTVIIGSPPTGCFAKGAAGVPDPRGTASVAWSDGDWARLMGAAAMLMRSTFYTGLLCSGGANIPVYRIMNNASGGWVSGGRIFMYNPGMGAGSVLYTLAHESGHILAGRQPAVYQDFLGRGLMIKEGYIWTYPFDGVSFTNRKGAGIPSEDFAETIGAYVVHKTYNFKAGLSAESGANRKPLNYPGEYPLHYSYAKEILFGNIEF